MRLIFRDKRMRIALLCFCGLAALCFIGSCTELSNIAVTSTVPDDLRLGGISFYAENPLTTAAAVARRQFTTEETEIFAAFNFAGLQDGASWGYKWYLNEVEDETYSQRRLKWDLGITGTQVINLYNEAGLDPGTYRLEIYIRDQKIRESHFTVTTAGWALYAHPQQGFQVTAPTAWDYAENPQGSIFYPHPEITAAPEVSVTAPLATAPPQWDAAQMIDDDKPTAFVLLAVDIGQEATQNHTAEIVTEVIGQWQQQYPDMQTTAPEGFTLYDWQGTTQDFLHVTASGAARYGAVIALPIAQKVYVISFWAPAPEYDGWLARYFNPMLRSLQVDVYLVQTFDEVPVGWRAYMHQTPRFGLHYPATWQYAEDERGVIFTPPNGSGTTMFTLFSDPAWQETDAEKNLEFIHQTIARLTATYANVTTTAVEQIEIVGRSAVQQGYLYTTADGGEFGGTVIAVVAPGAVSVGAEQPELYVYVFLMTAESADYPAMQAEVFNPMLDSFTILSE